MKILVFSDSHGNTGHMAAVIRREAPDRVFHLGDCVRDAEDLQCQFPGLTVNYVRGNCDGPAPVPDMLEPILEGKRIFMTHGHLYRVKSDYAVATWAAREAGADFLLFGHTHEAYCERVDGLWIMNPGTCRGWGPSTYGTILLENGRTVCYTETI